MNSMCHMSDCDFEGAKTLKLSAKTADFGRLLQFFWKKNNKNAQKFGRGCIFNYMNFTNSPDIGQKHKTQAQIWWNVKQKYQLWPMLGKFVIIWFKNIADIRQILYIWVWLHFYQIGYPIGRSKFAFVAITLYPCVQSKNCKRLKTCSFSSWQDWNMTLWVLSLIFPHLSLMYDITGMVVR